MPYFPLYDNVQRSRTPWVTYAILLVNVLAFLYMWSLPATERERITFEHGFVPARVGQLVSGRPLPVFVEQRHPQRPDMIFRKQIGVFAPNPAEIVSSWFTCMFMHGGWWHLIGNMWFLWVFARSVEDRLGHAWFGVFYIAVGLIATACHWIDNPALTMPMVGASGALAGVLGAYVILFPRARVATLLFLIVFFMIFDLPAIVVLGVWFLVQFFEAHRQVVGLGGGVAWWAHIGGFLAGMGLMLAFTSPEPEPDDDDTDHPKNNGDVADEEFADEELAPSDADNDVDNVVADESPHADAAGLFAPPRDERRLASPDESAH
ncbi:MAG: rhomboid family intramembrane serine protease [Pirellulales bacterium]